MPDPIVKSNCLFVPLTGKTSLGVDTFYYSDEGIFIAYGKEAKEIEIRKWQRND